MPSEGFVFVIYITVAGLGILQGYLLEYLVTAFVPVQGFTFWVVRIGCYLIGFILGLLEVCFAWNTLDKKSKIKPRSS